MNEEDKREADADFERVKKAVEDLGEFFDTVQIFTTRHLEGDKGTVSYRFGGGNWHARYGQVREWLLIQEATTFKEARPYGGDPL